LANLIHRRRVIALTSGGVALVLGLVIWVLRRRRALTRQKVAEENPAE
jgi:hypothetical protein